MNQDIINDKDEIMAVKCAQCQEEVIYLKIINAAENNNNYHTQNLFCTQCLTQKKKNIA